MISQLVSSNGTYRTRASSDSGGVLVELSLVLGALIFIFGAVLSVGRLLNQLSWVSQTAYNVLLEGSSNSGSAVEEDMRDRASQLWDATQSLVGISRGVAYDRTSTAASAGSVDRSLVFELRGDLSTIFGQPLPLTLGVNLQGPILTGSIAAAGDLNQSQGPTNLYNCESQKCGASGQPACPSTSCSTCVWNAVTQQYNCPCPSGFPNAVCLSLSEQFQPAIWP